MGGEWQGSFHITIAWPNSSRRGPTRGDHKRWNRSKTQLGQRGVSHLNRPGERYRRLYYAFVDRLREMRRRLERTTRKRDLGAEKP